MEISSRVTKSLFYFLEKKQVSLSLETLEFSPSGHLNWLAPASVSAYITQAKIEYDKVYAGGNFYKDWAEASFSLRAWDGLDSVLRIMPSPEPERLAYFLAQFFSYFISPALKIERFFLVKDGAQMETSLSSKNFPEVAQYLVSCIIHIPCFTKNGNVKCSWVDNFLKVEFIDQQSSIFDTATSKTHITPELMSSLLEDFKKKEELLIAREKLLFKKEQDFKEKEKLFLLKETVNKKTAKLGLFSSVGQLFNLSKNFKLKEQKTKNKKTKSDSVSQMSFDLD